MVTDDTSITPLIYNERKETYTLLVIFLVSEAEQTTKVDKGPYYAIIAHSARCMSYTGKNVTGIYLFQQMSKYLVLIYRAIHSAACL